MDELHQAQAWPDDPTDEQVIDAIASLLGTSPEWNGDTLSDIGNLIGQVRPHPGDAKDYAGDLRAATGRSVPAAWDFTDPESQRALTAALDELDG